MRWRTRSPGRDDLAQGEPEPDDTGQDADDDSTSGVDVDDDDAIFGRTQSFGQLVKAFGSGFAQGAGAGADCRPGAHEEP